MWKWWEEEKFFKKTDPQTLPLHTIKVVPNFCFLLYSSLLPGIHYQSPFFCTDFLAGVSQTLSPAATFSSVQSTWGSSRFSDMWCLHKAKQSTMIAFFARDPGVQYSVSLSRHHRRFLWLWSHLQSTAVESSHDPWLHLTVRVLHLPQWLVINYFSIDKETEDKESKNVLPTSISNVLQLYFQNRLFFLPTPCSTGKWLLVFFSWAIFDMLGKKKSKGRTLTCLGVRENTSLLLYRMVKGKTEGILMIFERNKTKQCRTIFTHYTDKRIVQENYFNLRTFVLRHEISYQISYPSNVLSWFQSAKLSNSCLVIYLFLMPNHLVILREESNFIFSSYLWLSYRYAGGLPHS